MKYLLLLYFQIVFCQIFNNQPLSIMRINMATASLLKYNLGFFAGGSDAFGDIFYNNVDIFNESNNSWSLIYLSQPRSRLAATSLQNYGLVFFAGGFNDNDNGPCYGPCGTVEVFNISSNSIYTIQSLTTPRYNMAGTSLEKEGVVFFGGGFDGTNIYDLVEYYDVKNNIWSTFHLTYPRSLLTATSLNNLNLIFFIDGSNNGVASNKMEIFSYPSLTKQIVNLIYSRSSASSISYEEEGLIFIGGDNFNNFEIYNYSNSSIYTFELSDNNIIFGILPQKKIVFASGNNYVSTYNISNNKTNLNIDNQPSSNINPTYVVSLNNIVIFTSTKQDSTGNYIQITYSYYYCKKGNIWSNCSSCPGGYFCNNNYLPILNICPVGSYCPVNSSMSIYCQIGYFQPNQGMSQCYHCPSGFFSNGVGNNNCNTCNPGNYCPDGTIQIQCPAGTYAFTPLQTKCDICPAGYFCPPGTADFTPNACREGSFSKNGSSSCQNCPQGSVSYDYAQECYLCPPGTYNDVSGLKECIKCSQGDYCPEGAKFFSKCPANYYCENPGLLNQCPPGTYNNGLFNTNLESCLKCPKGEYCSGNGNNKKICRHGSYSDENGLSECKICPAGYYCEIGTINPIICPKNSYSLVGSVICINCEEDEYTNGPGASGCLDCSTSKFAINNFGCMNVYQKIIFIFTWFFSIISFVISSRKVYSRIVFLKENNVKMTLNNFLFYEKNNEEYYLLEDIKNTKIIIDEINEKIDLK